MLPASDAVLPQRAHGPTRSQAPVGTANPGGVCFAMCSARLAIDIASAYLGSMLGSLIPDRCDHGGSDAYSDLGDFDHRGGFNSGAGAGPDIRWGFSGLPADLRHWRKLHRL